MNTPWVRFLPPFLRIYLDGRLSLQNIISNTGWLTADRLLRLGLGTLVGVWIARYLGPVQFGVLNYSLAFASLFGALATLGLDSIIVREIVLHPEDKDETLGTAFTLRLLGGAVSLLVALSAITWLRPDDSLTQWIVGVVAIGSIFQAFDAIDFWFQAKTQSKFAVYAKNGAYLIITLVRVALLLLRAPLTAFVWAALIEIVLGSIGLALAYKMNGNFLSHWRFSALRARTLLSASWPLLLSGLLVMIYMRVDQIMLGQMVGDEAVGIYSAAVRLAEMWYFVPIALVSSVFPWILQSRQTDSNLYKKRLQQLFSFLTLLAYLVAVPITLLGRPLVAFLFGEAFAAAGASLTILVWAGVFVCLGVARNAWMVAEGLTGLLFATTAFGAATNIMLNLWLLPTYGPLGAAVATLTAQAVAVSLSTILFQKTRPIFRMQLRALLLGSLFS
jgi:PST family polysaccharide transporter